eukprot:COSAG02_NODE_9137_length_2314_cov_3.223375_2_plen_75_part_00
MGNACCGGPGSAGAGGDDALSRTRTPAAPAFLDIVATPDGVSRWSLAGRLPTVATPSHDLSSTDQFSIGICGHC